MPLLQEGLTCLLVGNGVNINGPRRIGASLTGLLAVIRALNPGGRDQSR